MTCLPSTEAERLETKPAQRLETRPSTTQTPWARGLKQGYHHPNTLGKRLEIRPAPLAKHLIYRQEAWKKATYPPTHNK
jgi:hypothetical protein